MLIVNNTIKNLLTMLQSVDIDPIRPDMDELLQQFDKESWKHLHWSAVGISREIDLIDYLPDEQLRWSVRPKERDSCVFIVSGTLDVWRDLIVKRLPDPFYEQAHEALVVSGHELLFKDYSKRKEGGSLVLKKK